MWAKSLHKFQNHSLHVTNIIKSNVSFRFLLEMSNLLGRLTHLSSLTCSSNGTSEEWIWKNNSHITEIKREEKIMWNKCSTPSCTFTFKTTAKMIYGQQFIQTFQCKYTFELRIVTTEYKIK